MSALSQAALHRNLARIVQAVPVMQPGDGMTAHDIWKRLDCWSFDHVRHRLRELAEAGRIVREPGGDVILYRRAAA